MTAPSAEPSAASRRGRLAGAGWLAVVLCIAGWAWVAWAEIGTGVGRALGGPGMDSPTATAMMVGVVVLTVVSLSAGVIAVFARRWVLLPVSMLLTIGGLVFIAAEITSG
jgi:hypothetical protein